MNCGDITEFAPLYLSGELNDAQHDLFRAHLAECRSCAELMQHQAALDARLRDALTEEMPDTESIARSVRGQIARERSRRFAIVAAAAAIVIAVMLGYRTIQPARLYADAALDHRLEVVEHQPRRWRSDPAEIEKLAARYRMSKVDSLAPAGYRLEHAKMCGIDGQPALHLVYTNGVREVSLFVRARGSGGKGLREMRVGSEHLASVGTDRLEAVVATAGSTEECLQFARFAAGML